MSNLNVSRSRSTYAEVSEQPFVGAMGEYLSPSKATNAEATPINIDDQNVEEVKKVVSGRESPSKITEVGVSDRIVTLESENMA